MKHNYLLVVFFLVSCAEKPIITCAKVCHAGDLSYFKDDDTQCGCRSNFDRRSDHE